MAILTRQDLKTWILQELGHPVVQVNVSTEQLDQSIDTAVEFFQEWHRDGARIVYYAHQLTQAEIDAKEFDVPDTITDVTEIMKSGSNFTFGTAQYQLRYNFVTGSGSEWIQFGLTDYTLARQYLGMIDSLLDKEIQFTFRKWKNTIELLEADEYEAGQYIVLECYQSENPEDTGTIFGDIWLKRYATARVKKIWGQILSKYDNMALPGGITMNGGQIYSEGVSEIERLETELKEEHQYPPMFFRG